MRVIKISLALWYDPFWFGNFRRSWKRRRFWLAIPATAARTGRLLAVQTGPLTLKLHLLGIDKGAPDHG